MILIFFDGSEIIRWWRRAKVSGELERKKKKAGLLQELGDESALFSGREGFKRGATKPVAEGIFVMTKENQNQKAAE